MDFMKGIGKRVANTAKVVGQKTASAAEIAKINGKQAALRDEMGKLYTQIGKEYYRAYRQSETADLSALCACLNEFQKQIDELDAQLEEMSDTRRCPACGAKQPKEDRFCPACGAKLDKEPEVAPALETDEPAAEESKAEESKAEESKAKDVVISWPDAREESSEPEAVENTEE